MPTRRLTAVFIILVMGVTIINPFQTIRAADYTYTVISTLNSGVGTLRWAINQANTHIDPADNVMIDFNLPVIDPNYDDTTEVWTLTPTEVLPLLAGSNITIDGYTQAGASLPTEWRSPVLKVVVDGSALPNNLLSFGLGIVSSNNEIRGLIIQNFPSNGIALGFPSLEVTDNVISGNCIGTDYECAHDEGNGGDGVFIGLGAKNNTIGGDSPEEKNFILFNGLDGVGIHGNGTDGNTVSQNIIISNDFHGVFIYGGSQGNIVGGDTEGERNLISANHKDGVRIHGDGSNHNIVEGNYIGTDSDGDGEIPNGMNGLKITDGAQENVIGGSTPGSGNLISGNIENGVLISGTNTINNTISGNLIGTNVDGSVGIPNGSGVFLWSGASNNLIGGDTPEERNVISGNRLRGVHLYGDGTNSNVISGNFIGTTSSGLVPLGNGNYGIKINGGARDNTIGGSSEGEGNVVSANDDGGISIGDGNTSGNIISGNTIGISADGSVLLGNLGFGINISKAPDGDTIGPGNVIGYNLGPGVEVIHSSSLEIIITQNRIFQNLEGIILEEGANGGINPPVILSASDDSEVSGTTCGDCIVEVFWNHSTDGQGEIYLDTATANSAGEFNLTLPWRVDFNLTATATDPSRGTSAFSDVFRQRFIIYLPITMNGE